MKDILATLEAAGSFRTLLAVLDRGGLAAALRESGPHTLFAPNDDAFEQVNVDVLAGDREQSAVLMNYHLVAGKVRAQEIAESEHLQTEGGKSLTVRREGGQQTIDNATYVEADIECANGVVHVIDHVFLPRMSGWYCGGCC